MKYRELTPNEIEAYNIGYKVGARQIFITDIEWENDGEHKIYRKGYLAGCKDRHRNNVNNVNNVKTETMSNSKQCQNRDSDNDTYIDTDIVIEEKNKGGMGGKREKINEDTHFCAGGQMWVFPFEFRALAKKYWTDETIREIEKMFSCQEKDTEVSIRTLLDAYPENKSKPKKKSFTAPTLEEWNVFCQELHLDIKRMESIYYGYSENDWHDSHGNQIKNWKMKIRQVWDKPENKDPDADIVGEVKIIELEE